MSSLVYSSLSRYRFTSLNATGDSERWHEPFLDVVTTADASPFVLVPKSVINELWFYLVA